MVVYPPWNKLDTELVSFLDCVDPGKCFLGCTLNGGSWQAELGSVMFGSLSRLSDEQPTLASMNARGVLFFGVERETHEQREKLEKLVVWGIVGTLLRTCAGIMIVEQTIIGILLTWTTSIITCILRGSHGASKKECAGCVEQYAQWSLSTWIDPTIEYTRNKVTPIFLNVMFWLHEDHIKMEHVNLGPG